MDPFVSVIMPVYNSAKFLKEAIESVLGETYTNFEFLIYDDNSNDGSLEIIQDFASKDKRIKLFKGNTKQKNVSIIYKLLSDISKGKYFIPTDSDDICCRVRLQTLINAAHQNNSASLIFGKTKIINEDGTETIDYCGGEVSPYKLFLRNFVPDGASLISKEHYVICGGYNENIEWAEDYELRLRLLEQGPFVYVDKEVYWYRKHNNSWTSKKRNIRQEEIFKKKIARKSIKLVENILTRRKRARIKNNCKYNYGEYVAIKFSAAFYLSRFNLIKAYKLFNLLSPSNLPLISIFWLFVDRIYSPPKVKVNSPSKIEHLPHFLRNPIEQLFKSAFCKIDYKTDNNTVIDKTIVTKEIFKNKLLELGLQEGQTIIVHSSLSSLGFVVGGSKTIVDTLKEIIGKNGLILMPAFTYYTESEFFSKKYFSIDSICSKDIGIIAETFRRASETYRNFHPFTSFSFWGKNAKECAEKYFMADSFTINSPLGEILKGNGYILTLGTDFSTITILHTAEYLSDVPYSEYKSTFNYIDNSAKRSVELRRTGHSGEFNKISSFFRINNKVRIGNAQCYLIDARQIVQKTKEALLAEPDLFLCKDKRCKTCRERRKMCITHSYVAENEKTY